jgi:hypothetical protein
VLTAEFTKPTSQLPSLSINNTAPLSLMSAVYDWESWGMIVSFCEMDLFLLAITSAKKFERQ